MAKYVIPPPALPKPAVRALAVPTIRLSKKFVDQAWQGTKDPPRIPMKNRRASKPRALWTAPAKKVGRAPKSRQPAKVQRAPKRSQQGPATTRTSSVATKARILELAISACLRWRSAAIISLRSGGKAYHDQNAIMKPNHEKKNTLPYMLKGLSAGIDSAFKLIGLTFGARHKDVIVKPIFHSVDGSLLTRVDS